MAIDTFRDPLYIKWYTDSQGNKISVERLNEQYQVVKNKITLAEIPDEFDRVQINNFYEVKLGKTLDTNEFSVNYALGEITFHSSQEAKTIIINRYKSRGIIYYPASRIYTEWDSENNGIKETLKNVVDNLNHKGDYSNIVQYYPRNIVYYAGGSYMCIQRCLNIPPSNTSYWQQLTSPGLDLVFRGEYDNALSYDAKDAVSYGGSIYYCLTNSTGHLPTETSYWSIFMPKSIAGILKNTTTFNTPKSNVQIGISGFNYQNDELMVFVNSTYVEKDKDYTMNIDGLSIDKIGGSWSEDGSTTTINFLAIKNVLTTINFNDGSLIQDASVPKTKLTLDVQNKLDEIGILSNLTTTEKTNLVDAVSEVKDEVMAHKADMTTVSASKLSNTLSTFTVATGLDSNGVSKDYNSILADGIVKAEFKGETGGVGDIELVVRGKNYFDNSKIEKGTLLNGQGNKVGSKTLNITDYIYLKSGSYKVQGIPNSALSGSNDFFILYNASKVFQSFVNVSVTAPTTFTMPYDGYIRTTVHDLDINTFQIEKGAVTTAYEKGRVSNLNITLGTYEDGTPFKLNKISASVYDEVVRTNDGYIRIQRIDADGVTQLAKPLVAFEGELGFDVTGNLYASKNDEVLVLSNLTPTCILEYSLTHEGRNVEVIEKLKKIENEFLKKTNYEQPHFEKLALEKMGTIHAGGYSYSGLSSGATIKGKEIYVTRCSTDHSTLLTTKSTIVAYTRENDGSFTPKILPLDYTQGDFRDPNITTDKSGERLIFTATSYDMTTYKLWLYLFDENLNAIGTPILITTGKFGWGNTLITPTGKLIKCAYDTSIVGGSGVYLFKSSGDISNIGTFTQVAEVFPQIADKLNEATIAYWGNKLVAICRANTGNGAVATTTNLEGDSGWTYTRMPFTVHAPAVEPYIPKNEPFIACISTFKTTETLSNRRPAFTASIDLVNWVNPVYLVPSVQSGSGYASFVRNRYGYGVQWYEEFGTAVNTTNLFFDDVDIYRYIGNLRALEYQLANTP